MMLPYLLTVSCSITIKITTQTTPNYTKIEQTMMKMMTNATLTVTTNDGVNDTRVKAKAKAKDLTVKA